jgi:hypothetical protein
MNIMDFTKAIKLRKNIKQLLDNNTMPVQLKFDVLGVLFDALRTVELGLDTDEGDVWVDGDQIEQSE